MAARDLIVSSLIRIPAEDLSLQFSRSSGAGGQNVNKVNSRAELRFQVGTSSALPEDVRQRLMAMAARKISHDGVLQISSQRFRDQGRNIDDCYDKLKALIEDAMHVDPTRRPTRPSRGATQRRLTEKKTRSRIKEVRRRVDEG